MEMGGAGEIKMDGQKRLIEWQQGQERGGGEDKKADGKTI